ncbi:MAG: hypothetical protein MJ210_04190, partial [Alphaproteobacteria bacterium]|nr:hypothetical protein [Alphaproteobacteria bacterium]
HISIHHKIPEKYHNLFKNPEDQFLLNDISNFEMVVGGALHKDMHKDDLKNIIKIMPVKNSAVLCVPGSEHIDFKGKVEIPFDIKEPEKLTELRPEKLQSENMSQNKNKGKKLPAEKLKMVAALGTSNAA